MTVAESELTDMIGWSAANGHLPILNIALQKLSEGHSPKPEILNKPLTKYRNFPPLHLAAKTGWKHIVLTLLSSCDASLKCTPQDRTALHYAIDGSHIDVVGALYASSTWPQARLERFLQLQDRMDGTPVQLAIRKGQLRTLQMFHVKAGVGIYRSRDVDLAFRHRQMHVFDAVFCALIIQNFPDQDRLWITKVPFAKWMELLIREIPERKWMFPTEVCARLLQKAAFYSHLVVIRMLFSLRGLHSVASTLPLVLEVELRPEEFKLLDIRLDEIRLSKAETELQLEKRKLQDMQSSSVRSKDVGLQKEVVERRTEVVKRKKEAVKRALEAVKRTGDLEPQIDDIERRRKTNLAAAFIQELETLRLKGLRLSGSRAPGARSSNWWLPLTGERLLPVLRKPSGAMNLLTSRASDRPFI